MKQQKKWLITGVAGFIGSALLERLLSNGQQVVGLDNLSTGHLENLRDVERKLSPDEWANFKFICGDITTESVCQEACEGVDLVLHQAALGSVPRSIADPIATNAANVTGFVNLCVAAKDNRVRRMVYAASSSTYGDSTELPKREQAIGNPLSPYAVTKLVNELYAANFHKTYGLNSIGLRYFNVFGRRQDPEGAYAAVIPKWIRSSLNAEPVYVNGDGHTSRDFCYIENVVDANLLAATVEDQSAVNEVYNIAVGEATSLLELYHLITKELERAGCSLKGAGPIHRDFRDGDVRHSLADISKAQRLLGYSPKFDVRDGIRETVEWYVSRRK